MELGEKRLEIPVPRLASLLLSVSALNSYRIIMAQPEVESIRNQIGRCSPS